MSREELIGVLRSLLLAELSSVELYAAHADVIEEEAIARGVKEILETEKEHLEKFMLRIKALGGDLPREAARAVTVGRAAGISSGGDVVAMLKAELAEEEQAVREYSRLVGEMKYDDDTLLLLASQLIDEIKHRGWLKKKLSELQKEREVAAEAKDISRSGRGTP